MSEGPVGHWGGLVLLLRPDTLQDLVCNGHRHAAEVGHKVDALGMGGEATLRAPPRVLLGANWEHVTAMAAPVGRKVRKRLEAMGDPVVDLLLVGVRLSVALANTFGDDASVALGMACVLAVFTLHASRVFEEIPAEGAAHDVVELALDKLVAVHFVDLLLPLAHGALAVEASIHHAGGPVFLDKVEAQMDLPCRLEVEPSVDGLGCDGGLVRWRLRSIHGALGLAARRGWGCRKLGGLRAHGELSGRSPWVGSKAIGRHPPGTVVLGLDLLATELLGDIGNPDPEQRDGDRVLARLIVGRQFYLVCLIDDDGVVLGLPSVITRSSCPGHNVVLHLDRDKRLRSAREPSQRGMIDILDGQDANGELTA